MHNLSPTNTRRGTNSDRITVNLTSKIRLIPTTINLSDKFKKSSENKRNNASELDSESIRKTINQQGELIGK